MNKDIISDNLWEKLITAVNRRIPDENDKLLHDTCLPNQSGFYRPVSVDGKQRVSISRIGGTASIWIFSESSEKPGFYIDLHDFGEKSVEQLSDEDLAALKEREERALAERAETVSYTHLTLPTTPYV